jgi:hypothetical protein
MQISNKQQQQESATKGVQDASMEDDAQPLTTSEATTDFLLIQLLNAVAGLVTDVTELRAEMARPAQQEIAELPPIDVEEEDDR